MPANPAFDDFCRFLRERTGIALSPSKAYLVESRLLSLMQAQGFKSIDELMLAIRQIGSISLQQAVIERMTTNETFWFRDQYPFDYFAKHCLASSLMYERCSPSLSSSHKLGVMPLENGLLKKTHLRVWSAACSAGQEPYSLAMLASQSHSSKRVEILASDLSEKILEKAKLGVYNELEVARGLKPEFLQRYFHRKGDTHWEIDRTIRSAISFRQLNLISDPYPVGKWDVIFCRNVLIYFDVEMKREILLRLHRSLAPKGVLFLGASEGIQNMSEYFDLIHCSPGIAFQAK